MERFLKNAKTDERPKSSEAHIIIQNTMLININRK